MKRSTVFFLPFSYAKLYFLFFGTLAFGAALGRESSSERMTSASISAILLFAPDSLYEDSSATDSIEKIAVYEIYEVGDSANVVTFGLDTILLYHTEPAINYVVEGTTKEFYLGEEDTLVNLYSLLDSSHYYVVTDTSYLQSDMQLTLDSIIADFFITRDTILFSNDSISFFIATDTAAYYIPLGETKVYRLHNVEDTTIEEGGMERIGISSSLDVTRGDIEIYLGGNPKEVNQNLFGFTLEGAFLPNHLPETDVLGVDGNNPDAWQWMVDLKPRSLRFPGGASSKFMHLLPYDTNGDNVNDKFPTGYGYDINEIIAFYDMTDNVVDIGGGACGTCIYTFTQVKNDLADGDDDEDGSVWEVCTDEWLKPIYNEDLISFYNKWNTQDELPAGEKPYIDEFIDFVAMIEDEYNYKIDIILDLNILSSSASQCVEIVNYMRNATENGVTDVNVVGVEMGNECYFKWLNELMRIDGFEEYWDYLNGVSVSLANAVPSWVVSDHNYINAFRTGTFVSSPIKIGLPAENPDEVDDDGTVVTSDWNEALGDIVNDDTENDKFDAVIIHNYFDAQKNWQGIPHEHMCLKYPNFGFPACTSHACLNSPLTPSRWRYDVYDERLREAFDGFLGVDYDYDGNMKDFLKDEYYEDFSLIRTQLYLGYDFPDLTTNGIEIWNTEKNLKDKLFTDPDDELSEEEKKKMQNLNSIYNNSFPHGLLMQEWFLNDIKLNFKRGYGAEFITYSHYHNYAGGAWSDMLVPADCADFLNHIDEFGEADPLNSADYNSSPYYMRRTTYWTMKLLSEISKNSLKYLPSHFEMGDMNPNLVPTVFVKPNNYLYFYYTNMKAIPQEYIIYPNDIEDLFGGNRDFISFSEAGIYNITVDLNYMSSGKNTLFAATDESSVNNCYDCSSNKSHPFHIYGIDEGNLNFEVDEPTEGVYTVTVPPNSMGYFKLRMNWGPAEEEREGESRNVLENDIQIFPNPTGHSFKISSELGESYYSGNLFVEIISLTGESQFTTVVKWNEDIDISALTNGLYFVVITDRYNVTVTKQLVKVD